LLSINYFVTYALQLASDTPLIEHDAIWSYLKMLSPIARER